ncbi:MAG: SpoIIE family protein phosphatase [Actinomycetota bacterium]|nr:SpoIIE family protein phosphatase [Actinomycetota bacterium]
MRRGQSLNLQAIAEAAGVSRSTLHRHFRGRAELEAGLREEALGEARRAIAEAIDARRPPLAVLKQVTAALVGVTAGYPVDLVPGEHDGAGQELAGAIVPLGERLAVMAELAPIPPHEWLLQACAHFVAACLHPVVGDPGPAAEALFREVTEPLDQGLVVLDADGSVVSINATAASALQLRAGERLTKARIDVVYEDGSACPADDHPLRAAVRAKRRRSGVRGHRGPDGTLTWLAVDAIPLRRRNSQAAYGLLGILSDVTAERDWERQQLRAEGIGTARRVPFDIARVLDEIPPHLFPEQFVSEARRIAGGPVALYVLDIDGTHLLRLAGAEEFPDRLDAPLALGPELAEDGVPELKARIDAEFPGVSIAPMWLRGRALGLLLALRASGEPLRELARHGAAAMELAGGYTDVIDAARRRKETHAAAELQQSLLPPRIARIGGGVLAGGVLPSYEVGGDWFDYVENRDGAWIAIADAVGKGATAGALGGIALSALRAARRDRQSLEEAARTMHEVVYDVGRPEFFVTAIIARWHAVYSVFSWINCGHPPPLVVRPDDTVEQLPVDSNLPLGVFDRERKFTRRQRRLEEGERLVLHSDGITARRTTEGLFGLDGIEKAIRGAPSRSATTMAKSIQEAVMSASEDALQDDAVVVVLAPESHAGR